MPSQQNVTLKAKGLYTFPNALSEVPDGALSEASNVVIDRDGVINPRRGIQLYGNTFGNPSDRAKQLLVYRDRILRHWGTEIDCDSDGVGTFTVMNDINGSPAVVNEVSVGTRIKYTESNGNLYFTTSNGIYKISDLDVTQLSTSPITVAGGVKALDANAVLDPETGWFVEDSVVAYRVVWGIKDANSNVILGVPSERVVIYNPLINLLVNDYNTMIGNLASVAAVAPFTLSGNEHSNTTIDGLSSTTNLSVGMTVSGTGIQAATIIMDIVDPNTITLSLPATATATGVTLTFGQKLHDTDYASLKIPANSDAVVVYNSLEALAFGPTNKLDNDMGGTVFQDIPFGSSFTLVGDTHNSTVIDNLSDTSSLVIGMTVAGADIPADTTITAITGLTSITISAAATGTNAGETFTFGPFSVPVVPTPTQQLVQIQSYFDAIINALNTTTGISTYAKNTAIGGAFSNSTQSATVDLTFTIPSDVTTVNFYQIYRSGLFTSTGVSLLSDLTPDDELRLIYENNPTDADITAKSITFHDTVPDSFRENGANLYTNANSGEGIAQANEPPPLALDIALFKGSVFYANTSTRYNIQVGLLTALGLTNKKIYIIQGNTVNAYTFVNSVQQVTQITMIAGSDLTASGISDYFDIYNANNTINFRIWFQVGTSVAPSGSGVTLVECPILNSDSDSDAATKLSYILNNIPDFFTTTSSNILTVTNENTGPSNNPTENVTNVGFSITVITSGSGEDASQNKVGISNAATPAEEVDETARSLVRVINKNSSEVINAFYVSGPDDLPGLIEFEARTLGDPNFYVMASDDATAQKFNPALQTGNYETISAISVANPTVVTSVGHGLSTGNTIVITGSDSTPSIDGMKTVTKIDNDNFTVDVDVTIAGTTGNFTTTANALAGDNEVVPNRIYYSKFQQPEAVPIVNYQDVGAKNKRILRILPLRDNLFILTEGGVYRLSGDDTTNFQIALFDSSTQIKAVDSAVVLNNQIYMFSSQGIATISETGISIISRPIENKLLPLVTSLYPGFSTATFAVSYESDRAYILFTVSEQEDTVATIVYRFNTFTNTWVSWDVTKTCGVVNSLPDKFFMGAGDTNSVELERKSFTRLDYADRQYTQNVPNGAVFETSLSLGSLFEAVPGDVLVQTQYLTIAQTNRLLKYMDTDMGLLDKNYFSSLGAMAGTNLRDLLTSLATKIDNDPGIATPGYAAAISGFGSSFIDTQNAFNVIVGRLNVDANTHHHSYLTSVNTVEYEVPVSSTNSFTKVITMEYAAPIIAGPIVIYKHIDSSVTWVPHHFGDASMLKQVSESTLLFETMDFTQAIASFSSDLSPGFESIPFPGEGTGIWGGFSWGDDTWGGEGTSRPFRTYVPANKQRCRYINGQFEHGSTFEDYAIFGISYTFSPISSRAYR